MPAIAFPCPVGGWNARDALDKMDPTDAVKMVNLIPRAGYCETRKGSLLHVSGLGGPVDSLIPYRGTGGADLIAAANGNLWDITSGVATSLKSGLTNNRWQYNHFNDLAILTNGVDTPQVYNGAVFANIVVTGVTATTLWGSNTFKGRAYYWQQNAQSFWYAAAGSYQGALTKFDLSTQIQSGGSLIMMVTWTLDSGDGIDDLAAFVFSTGEVLLYAGDDPGNAAAWALQGRFQIGEPLGIRAHEKVGGTEIIITRDGYVDLGAALNEGRYSEESSYSAKIIQAAKNATNLYNTQFGWEAILYPSGQLFIVNVPQTETQIIQHARSTSNGGWCSFEGWNAKTFAVHNNELYYGDPNGNVYKGYIGSQDNASPINVDCITAFNALGSRSSRKQVTAVNVVSNYSYPALIAIDVLADFNISRRSTVTTGPYVLADGWDTVDWDAPYWADEAELLADVKQGWRNARGIGDTVALSIRWSTRVQSVIWYSTKIQYKNAGVI
jgi:hypothetical protein